MSGEVSTTGADDGTSARRGRPPIDAHRVAVLDATRALLVEVGYEQMTFESVARRAGLYRRYLSRSWGSKAELVRDALFEDVAGFVVPDAGTLDDDLRAIVRQHVELIRRPEFLCGLPALQEALRIDRELWDTTLERHVRPPVDAFGRVFRAAVDRGEIVGHLPPEVALNSMTGALQQLARLGYLSADELVEHGVALVSRAMVQRPTG